MQIQIGCSGWHYTNWKGRFYPDALPKQRWLDYYAERFGTVELNSPFYHWPKPATVEHWRRAAPPGFKYAVKVNREITHVRRFKNAAQMLADFYRLEEGLGEHAGLFLFQLPGRFTYTPERLQRILSELDLNRTNAVEFRHPSWWNDTVFEAFSRTKTIFCAVSAPDLPDGLIRTAPDVYLRFHGSRHWYTSEYSEDELTDWAERIRKCGARTGWIYFNNTMNGFSAPRNAESLRAMLFGAEARAASSAA